MSNAQHSCSVARLNNVGHLRVIIPFGFIPNIYAQKFTIWMHAPERALHKCTKWPSQPAP